MNLSLIEFQEDVLERSLNWLNDDEIKFLTNSPQITREAQEQWYISLSSRKDYLVKVVVADGQAIGVVGLKRIDEVEKKAEYFGYIGDKDFWGKGIGNWMLSEAFEIAIGKELNKIYLNVIVENYKAINLYFKYQFKIIKYTDKGYLMERPIK